MSAVIMPWPFAPGTLLICRRTWLVLRADASQVILHRVGDRRKRGYPVVACYTQREMRALMRRAHSTGRLAIVRPSKRQEPKWQTSVPV